MYFKKEKKRLNKHLLHFSSSIEKQVSYALQALSDLDLNLSKHIIKANINMGHSAVDIEEECLKLLALYQPVANDLRLIVSVLKISGDLERIGDYAVMIAEEVNKLAALDLVDVPDNVYELSAQAKIMLRKSLLGFVELDLHVVQNVLREGHALNGLSESVYQHELQQIKEDVASIEQHLCIMNVSRQLQHIADHAMRIAEDTGYLMKGEIIRHKAK